MIDKVEIGKIYRRNISIGYLNVTDTEIEEIMDDTLLVITGKVKSKHIDVEEYRYSYEYLCYDNMPNQSVSEEFCLEYLEEVQPRWD